MTMQQRSPEWYEARAGKVTASRFKTVLNGTERGWQSYMRELDEGGSFNGNSRTQWGQDNEDEAVAMFELVHDVDVEEVGFIVHPDYPLVGSSPDFLLGDTQGGEVKCPSNPEIHMVTLIAGAMPEEHMPQVQGNMWVTGRQAWWFISYDPRQDPDCQLFIQLIQRDDEYIAKLESRVLQFIECWQGDRDTSKYFASNLDIDLPKLF